MSQYSQEIFHMTCHPSGIFAPFSDLEVYSNIYETAFLYLLFRLNHVKGFVNLMSDLAQWERYSGFSFTK